FSLIIIIIIYAEVKILYISLFFCRKPKLLCKRHSKKQIWAHGVPNRLIWICSRFRCFAWLVLVHFGISRGVKILSPGSFHFEFAVCPKSRFLVIDQIHK